MSTQWSGCPWVRTTAVRSSTAMCRCRLAEGAVAAVEPEGVAGGPEQVAAAGAAGRARRRSPSSRGRSAPPPRLHRVDLGAEEPRPERPEVAGSPLVRNVRRGRTRPPGRRRAPTASRTAATANAVSSPLETSTTRLHRLGPSRRRSYGPAAGSGCSRARACRRRPPAPGPAAARRGRAPGRSRRRRPRRTRRSRGRRRRSARCRGHRARRRPAGRRRRRSCRRCRSRRRARSGWPWPRPAGRARSRR